MTANDHLLRVVGTEMGAFVTHPLRQRANLRIRIETHRTAAEPRFLENLMVPFFGFLPFPILVGLAVGSFIPDGVPDFWNRLRGNLKEWFGKGIPQALFALFGAWMLGALFAGFAVFDLRDDILDHF